MHLQKNIGTFFILAAVACGGAGDKDTAKQADKAPAAEAAPEAEAAPDAETAEPEVPAQVAKAAKLADAIEADPESADQILADLEMNREDLDSLMFEIAADPLLSAAYQQARTG